MYGAVHSDELANAQEGKYDGRMRLTPCTASVGSLVVGRKVMLSESDKEVELQTYIGAGNKVEVIGSRLW
jgi:hypothetical protein